MLRTWTNVHGEPMFNRKKFLIIHGQDPVAWSKKYDLEPFTHPCYRCKATCSTTLPFASGNLRGLIAPACACGHPNPPYCVVNHFGAPGSLTDLFNGQKR